MVRTSNHSRNNCYGIRGRYSAAASDASKLRSLELDEWVEDIEDTDEYDSEDYYWLYEGMELF